MKTIKKKKLFWILLLALAGLAGTIPILAQQPIVIVPNGATITSPSDIVSVYQTIAGHWINVLQGYTYDIFWTLAGLEIAVLGIDAVVKYRMNFTVIGFVALNKLLIIGAFLTILMNGDQWLPAIVNSFQKLGQVAAGIDNIQPSGILAQGVTMAGKLLWCAVKASFFINLSAAAAFVIAALVIVVCFIWITAHFVLAKIETSLAIAMAWIFFAFGSSRWTVPYAERSFAYCVASGVKMMVLYMMLGLGTVATNSWVNSVDKMSFWYLDIGQAWIIMAGAVLYAMVVFGTSKLVSGILGGAPAFTPSEIATIVGMAATATAATLGLVSAGTSSAAAAAVKGAASATGAAAASTTAAAGNANPPAQPSAPGMATTMLNLQKVAQTTSRVANSIPSSGSSSAAPRFNGFHRDD